MYLTFKSVMRTSREPHYLENYNSLPSIFDCLARSFENLTYINLSNNYITDLPKEFGTLPFLKWLILSGNCLGTFDQYKWLWLEQPAIRKNLLLLDISYNLLTELPIHINKLCALEVLKISHNKLQRLSQCIGEFINLNYLDVSHNRLLCLPYNILKLPLYIINISMNPFMNPFIEYHIYNHGFEIPTLVEFSANAVQKYRIKYNANLIPYTLVIQLDKAENCILCGRICIDRWCKMLNIVYNMITSIKIIHIWKEEHHRIVRLEKYHCVFCCKKYHAWLNRRRRNLIF